MNILDYIPYEIDLERALGSPLIWQDYEDRVSSCPESVRTILCGADTASFLLAIGSEFNLTDNQSQELTRIVRDILISKLYIGDMPVVIQRNLSLDQASSKKIAEKIIKELFVPAIEDIKKMQVEKFPDRIGKSNQPPQTTDNVLNLRKK